MRVYVESSGCTQNLGEAHALETQVHEAGHSLTADPATADVGVLVTCGVIESTESRMVRRWEEMARRIPRVVVTGCLVPLRSDLLRGPGRARTTLLPIRDQPRLPDLLAEWAQGSPAVVEPRPAPPTAEAGIAEVVIAQGCTSHCSYCFSRLARGRLKSVPLEEVLTNVRKAAARGAVEVRVSSLDTSCWGEDRNDLRRLPELLDAIAGVPGPFRVRVGMMSPQSLEPIHERYFESLRRPRFFRFVHLPVQSGSDTVLRRMRRGYDVAEFRALVAAGRARLPGLMLATDIIVGFPGESEEDFRPTVELVEAVGPEIVNVTRFSARPMTPAYREPRLPTSVVKERSRALTEVRMRRARQAMERWIGSELDALVTEPGAGGTSVARLPNYLPVVVPERHPLGASLRVRVDGARATYLIGRTLETAPPLPPGPAL